MDDRQPGSTAEVPVTTTGTGAGLPTVGRNEFKIVLLLCALAAVHVFVFAAAFPFFNNVDEPIHFDLVLRYAHGQAPHRLERVLPETVEYVAFFNSWAYYAAPVEYPGGQLPPPPWTEPPDKERQDFQANCQRWQSLENYEFSQAPLYYAAAGLWWDVGRCLGIHRGRLLYWLRFFNILEVVVLVWLSYAIARIVFPDNSFMRLAVPALVTVLPQTAFYSIGNDVLPALCFGATFLFLLKWIRSGHSPILATMTGIAFAATYLSKSTTLPLLAAIVALALFHVRKLTKEKKSVAPWSSFAAFFCCSVTPILGWMIWSKVRTGDFTGAAAKMQHFGWTLKPIAEWPHHPIFTPTGFWTYVSGQLSTFWQGEFQWHQQPLMLPGSSVVYTLFTLFLLVVAAPSLSTKNSNTTSLQRQALSLGFICFAAGMVFFAFTSIIYDFHDCPYPSRQHPYFTSGRLLLGALIPFLILAACGINRILNRFGMTARFLVLATIILLILGSEIVTDRQVFLDPYNWYHLP
ncbi:MAG TPA: DUF2142 domain-containing protein [Verrucomicrobiae bacterium]|jgi:hypothetical protein|nr:DUF2142 domain-containing protein [Verrucomicrobiae bacterium]